MCASNLCEVENANIISRYKYLKSCTFTYVFILWFQRTCHMVQPWGTRWHQGNHMWTEQIHALNNRVCGKRNKNGSYFVSSAPAITETLVLLTSEKHHVKKGRRCECREPAGIFLHFLQQP